MSRRTAGSGRAGTAAVACTVAVAGAVLLLSTAGGCYKRVTRASGIGADEYPVSESYQQGSRLDTWIFGEEERRDRRTGGSRLP